MYRVFLAGIVAVGMAVPAPAQTTEPRGYAHLFTAHRYNEATGRGSWPRTTMRPARGPYDSTDAAVLVAQLQEMRCAGLGPWISWWGPEDTAGDPFLEMFVSIEDTGVPGILLYEGQARLRARPDGWIDFDDEFNRERFAADMRHLYDRFLSGHPERFKRQDGRFVVVAWPSHIYRGRAFAELGKRLMAEMPLYLVSTDLLTRPYVRPDAADVIGGFAAVSAYGIYLPEVARELGPTLNGVWFDRWGAMAEAWDSWLAVNEPQVQIILPLQFMFDDHIVSENENPVLSTDDHAAAELVKLADDRMTDSQRRAGRYLNWFTFDSWSEYFEGSAVEPSDRYGSRFLDIITERFGPRLSSCPR